MPSQRKAITEAAFDLMPMGCVDVLERLTKPLLQGIDLQGEAAFA
jgi:hypothetical protein